MKKLNRKKILPGIFLILLSCLFSAGASFLYGRPENEQIRNTVMFTVCALCVVYGWYHYDLEDELDYNNSLHLTRFLFFFVTGTLFACLLPLFPFSVWPVVALAIALSFFSNAFLGLFSYGAIIMFAAFLSEASLNVFFLYFLSGSMAILLFRNLDESFQVGIPTITSMLFFFVAETATIVLFINERLTWEMFLMPVMNVCLTGLLFLCVLKYFSFSVIHQYRNRYLEVNDPEFELMAELKKEAKDDYFLALHTAYFSERIASSIHADVALAKAGAYYHRFGKIYRENGHQEETEEEIIHKMCKEYEFPVTIRDVILECASRRCVSKESTIVMFADAIVTSVLFLFEKDPDGKPDYDQVVDMIFTRKQQNGSLDTSLITVHDLSVMKEIFTREKLYYDFLR
ncbi:hypothetical protein V1224_08835 [Lachnospiraceae bacterium JLR.KK008]